MLSTYVYDLALAGPEADRDAFWEKLTTLVDVEPPEQMFSAATMSM